MSAMLKRMAGGLVFKGYYLSTISSSRLKSVKRKDTMQKKGGFLKLYHNTWNEISHLKFTEKFLYVYLVSKQNSFGDRDFYLTDKQIVAELGICRETLRIHRKSLKNRHLIDYEPGKYRKSACFYAIKRLNSGLKAPKICATRRCNIEDVNKKKGLQPIIINNTIINKTEKLPQREVDEEFLKQMSIDRDSLLRSLRGG